jgi:hypothetical protein
VILLGTATLDKCVDIFGAGSAFLPARLTSHSGNTSTLGIKEVLVMTGFQLTRPRAASWTEPVQSPAGAGRHASATRAKLNLRRMFYTARHAGR